MKFLSQRHCVWVMIVATCIAVLFAVRAQYPLASLPSSPPISPKPIGARFPFSTSSPNEAPLPTAWAVQLGAFVQGTHAERLLQRLREKGIPTYKQLIVNKKGLLTKVFLGPFTTVAQAKDWRMRIQANLGLQGFIVEESRYVR